MGTLLVLRHAETEATRPGHRDHERRLTPHGQAQATALGDHLRTVGTSVDLALCSSALRAQQTLVALDLGSPIETLDALYNAGAEQILEHIREVSDEVSTLLVVGHAPGLPALAHELADGATSDPEALRFLDARFPACALATLRVHRPWSKLRTASLAALRLP
jgi:phosphohistidine phosphatase